jgi:dTDP-glucose 4,6-dehydratase
MTTDMNNTKKPRKLLVTGGLGFIGSNFVEMALERGFEVVNIDKMTYAARTDLEFDKHPSYSFIRQDIADLESLPDGVETIVNFAAESHVDNSIASNRSFFHSNVGGVYNLLELIRSLEPSRRPLLLHISTDEVYGDRLAGSFTEKDALKPSNPYSASKAAAEELLHGWARTYGIHYRVTRSCNNYGYGQYAEKLIPTAIKLASKGVKMPVHGSGLYKREWLYVKDKCEAIFLVMDKGKDGEVYNISTNEEYTNMEIVRMILRALGKPEDFYEFVADRSGQDLRYSVSADKIRALGWSPKMKLADYIPQHIEMCKAGSEKIKQGFTGRIKGYLAKKRLTA